MSKMIASAKVGETLNPQVVALAKLGLTDEEINQVLADDKRIDKGEKLFELPDELKAGAKKARIMRSVDAYGKKRTREKKEDNDKAHLINLLAAAVSENPVITNPEREFEFQYNGRKFKVVLSCPRK